MRWLIETAFFFLAGMGGAATFLIVVRHRRFQAMLQIPLGMGTFAVLVANGLGGPLGAWGIIAVAAGFTTAFMNLKAEIDEAMSSRGFGDK